MMLNPFKNTSAQRSYRSYHQSMQRNYIFLFHPYILYLIIDDGSETIHSIELGIDK